VPERLRRQQQGPILLGDFDITGRALQEPQEGGGPLAAVEITQEGDDVVAPGEGRVGQQGEQGRDAVGPDLLLRDLRGDAVEVGAQGGMDDTLVQWGIHGDPAVSAAWLKAYLKPDRLSIVLVGYAPMIINELQRVAIRPGDVVPVADLDVTTADLRRPLGSRREPVVPLVPSAKGLSREEWENVRGVVDAGVAAAGGLDALRGVKTIRATARTVMQTPAGPMRATTRTFVEYPGRMRVDATLPAGEVVQAYVDGQAWLKDPTGVRDAPAPMRDEFAQGVAHDLRGGTVGGLLVADQFE